MKKLLMSLGVLILTSCASTQDRIPAQTGNVGDVDVATTTKYTGLNCNVLTSLYTYHFGSVPAQPPTIKKVNQKIPLFENGLGLTSAAGSVKTPNEKLIVVRVDRDKGQSVGVAVAMLNSSVKGVGAADTYAAFPTEKAPVMVRLADYTVQFPSQPNENLPAVEYDIRCTVAK